MDAPEQRICRPGAKTFPALASFIEDNYKLVLEAEKNKIYLLAARVSDPNKTHAESPVSVVVSYPLQ